MASRCIPGGSGLPSPPKGPISEALEDAGEGDSRAADRLLHLVFAELRRLAAARLARLPPGGTLQPTALVHDAYLRIMGTASSRYENRQHFFFAAGRAMRDLIAEQERRKARLKRDGGRRVTLDTGDFVAHPRSESLVDLGIALDDLEEKHPDWGRVVLLKFYTGLSTKETAEVLGASVRTVERRWSCAKAWLRKKLAGGAPEPA